MSVNRLFENWNSKTKIALGSRRGLSRSRPTTNRKATRRNALTSPLTSRRNHRKKIRIESSKNRGKKNEITSRRRRGVDTSNFPVVRIPGGSIVNVSDEHTKSLWMRTDVAPDAPSLEGEQRCDT